MLKFSSETKSRLFVVKLVLVLAGVFLTTHEMLARLSGYLTRNDWLDLFIFVAIWFFGIGSILLVAFSPSKLCRLIWIAPIAIATLIGDIYYSIAENRLTVQAGEAMLNAHVPVQDVLNFYGTYIASSLIRTLVLVVGMVMPPRFQGPYQNWHSVVPLVSVFLISVIVFIFAGTFGSQTRGMPLPFHTLGVAAVLALPGPSSGFTSNRRIGPVGGPTAGPSSKYKADPGIKPVNKPAVRHLALIIDESIAGDFIDLNIPRGVTPYLTDNEHRIVNFGFATSSNQCTKLSNAILRLGANPDLLTTNKTHLLTNPSIWKYAKAAGFHSNFIDGRRIFKKSRNLMLEEEQILIDSHINIDGAPDQVDMKAAKWLRTILSRSDPQFVVVNKMGAHFPFARMYPAYFSKYSPSMAPDESISSRERLVNSYMNAISWSVDEFFRVLLEDLDLEESLIIYTSDHGQSLMEDGSTITHCRQVPATLNEVLVPLLAITEAPELSRRLKIASQLNFGRVSHFEVFPTLLVLMGYSPEAVMSQYHPSLFHSVSTPMGVTSGFVSGLERKRIGWIARDDLPYVER